MNGPSHDTPDGGLEDDSTLRASYSRRGTPAPLVVAAGLTLLQGLATAGFGITEVVNIDGDRVAMGAAVAVFFVAYGVLLVVAAWALATVRSWARGPVLLAQLIWLGLAWNMRTGSTLAVAIVLAVVAALTLAGLLHPRSVDAVERAAGRR